MPPKELILLFGFDFEIQSRQVVDPSWRAAWLTSQYTEGTHEMWEQVIDPDKKREIKYGNNIAVLFTALVHCSKYYFDGDDFWKAIATGFNTSHTRVRAMATLLADARRAQRHKRSKDTSGTARAADEWIDFLDRHRPSDTIQVSYVELKHTTDSFYKKQRKAWLNAAWVPIVDKNAPLYRPRSPRGFIGRDRQPPEGPLARSEDPPRPPSPSTLIKSEPHPHSSVGQRKRAASPLPTDRIYKRNTNSMSSRPTEQQPSSGTSVANAQLQLPSLIAPAVTTQPSDQAQNPLREDTQLRSQPRSEAAELQIHIASLEKQLVDTKTKIQSGDASGALTTVPSNLKSRSEISGLKTDMASVVNAVGTMMESMHSFADNLHRIEDEVSSLNKSHNETKSALPQEATPAEAISAVVDSIKLLGDQLYQIQQEQQQQRAKADAGPDIEALRALLKDQGNRVDCLAREMASEMADLRRLQLQTQSLTRGPPPQTLQQAIAAAERDLQLHTTTIGQFYHKLDSNRVGRAVTERTAEFLALLDDSLRTARNLRTQN